MRTTILPSMLEIVTRNYNYRNKAVRLYELGKIYLPREDGLADEPKVLSLGAYGDGIDFFSFKGAVEAIARELRIGELRFVACTDNPSYHPGRCAKVFAGETDRRARPDPSAGGRQLRRGHRDLCRRASFDAAAPGRGGPRL